MNIIKKRERRIGITTRLVGDAVRHSGLYVAPNGLLAACIIDDLRKDNATDAIKRVRTMSSLRLNLPKDKSTPLYFDEGCDILDIQSLECNGYNVKTVVVGDYTAMNTCDALKKISDRIRDCIQPENPSNWKMEYDCLFYSSNTIPQIKKVVYDIPNGTTIVYFADDTKEIARVMDGDAFDKEVGVLQCVAKKMYGSRSRFLKDVVNKGVVVEKKEKKKKNNTYMDKFLKGEICIKCNGDQKYELLKLLDNTKCAWSNQTKPSGFNNNLFEAAKDVIIGVDGYALEEGCYGYIPLEWDDDESIFMKDGVKPVDYQDFVKSI